MKNPRKTTERFSESHHYFLNSFLFYLLNSLSHFPPIAKYANTNEKEKEKKYNTFETIYIDSNNDDPPDPSFIWTAADLVKEFFFY